MASPRHRLARRGAAAGLALTLTFGTAACSGASTDVLSTGTVSAENASVASDGLFDSSTVHDITIEVDQAAYDEAIATYLDSGEKDWVTATVTIDGETFSDVGMRLKGNSSLRGLTTEDAENPEDLPWLVRLDTYVDGQSLDGLTSFVIRSNTTETALNEAVALELIGLAGLATEEATSARVSVNGGEESLRLVIENPDDAWMADELGDGILYKAESTGDYTYRGDDAEAYEDVFDVEAGEEDYAPLTGFLQFLDESDDETFAAELPDRLDVDAFATYLAVQTLVDNFDDIDGPGNNSYLYYDEQSSLMTVVSWDQNLSFGVRNEGGGGVPVGGAGVEPETAVGERPTGERPAGGRPAGGPPLDGELPAEGPALDGELPADRELPADGEGGPEGLGGNVLAERFLADDSFNSLYTERLAELTEQLYDSGSAAEVLTTWTTVLDDQAADLVMADVIGSEAASIAAYFD